MNTKQMIIKIMHIINPIFKIHQTNINNIKKTNNKIINIMMEMGSRCKTFLNRIPTVIKNKNNIKIIKIIIINMISINIIKINIIFSQNNKNNKIVCIINFKFKGQVHLTMTIINLRNQVVIYKYNHIKKLMIIKNNILINKMMKYFKLKMENCKKCKNINLQVK
jgi:hypothetical protein